MNSNRIVLDIGNTQTKFAVVENDTIAEYFLLNDVELLEKISELASSNVIISSVRTPEFTKSISSIFSHPIVLNWETPIPITNLYKTPNTLGNDRLANAVGAWAENPNENNLIIDAGTCLKFDFINTENQYLGGSISPGIKMRFNALHTFTDNLPLIENAETIGIIGKSTNESIQTGVIEGFAAEINGMIEKYNSIYKNLNIILTGGDSQWVESLVRSQKNSIFADKFITLKGLNEILKYNDKK